MPEETHHFHIDSEWTGDSNGDGLVRASDHSLNYGLPPIFEGKSGRMNPEELLMSSVAACYSITLAVLAERRRLPIARIEVGIDGEVVRQAGGTLKFVSIYLKPKVHLASSDPAHIQAATDMAHKAEQYCVISNAIRGNVELSVDPEIITASCQSTARRTTNHRLPARILGRGRQFHLRYTLSPDTRQ